MKKNNIIDDWLDKYGDPEIDKNVEMELERLENIRLDNIMNNGGILPMDIDDKHETSINDG